MESQLLLQQVFMQDFPQYSVHDFPVFQASRQLRSERWTMH